MAVKINNYFENYKLFVTKNPLLANEIEIGLKWASYIVAGRFSQSPVVTEFIHSASKLLTLINDNILRRAAGIPISIDVTVERLQAFLTVIEYTEVFAEVATRQINGSRGRWLTVILLNLAKFVVRIILLMKHDQGLVHSPPIPPLNRRKEVPELCGPNEKTPPSDVACSNVQVTFTLKTSGRVMRTIDAAPPLVSRTWKLPKIDEDSCISVCKSPTKLSGKYLTAEMLHICRPLVHLASMGAFGEFSWKPFFIAFGIDIASLHLLKEKPDYNKAEKQELNRRALSLLLYLLRSPFYDHYSKMRIRSMLQSISNHLLGSGLLLRPILEYIPEWQQLYFYTWSL